MTDESKERVTNLTARIVLMLQQRNFTAEETAAMLKCLQSLFEQQFAKRKGDEG